MQDFGIRQDQEALYVKRIRKHSENYDRATGIEAFIGAAVLIFMLAGFAAVVVEVNAGISRLAVFVSSN